MFVSLGPLEAGSITARRSNRLLSQAAGQFSDGFAISEPGESHEIGVSVSGVCFLASGGGPIFFAVGKDCDACSFQATQAHKTRLAFPHFSAPPGEFLHKRQDNREEVGEKLLWPIMGKARRQKSHGNAARAAADASTAVAKEQQQQQEPLQMDTKAGGVLDGLTSLNAVTRESSCAAIASLFEKVDGPEAGSDSWAAAQRLIASGLVKKLLPRMVDRAPGVKMQATGAMRNISAVRDPRMCEILVSDDCLTPVLTLLDRMSSPTTTAPTGAAPTADASAQKQQALVTTLEQETVVVAQLVATLCNLLAAVDVAVGRFTRQGGLQVVMRLLLPDGCRGSSDIFGGALQVGSVFFDTLFAGRCIVCLVACGGLN